MLSTCLSSSTARLLALACTVLALAAVSCRSNGPERISSSVAPAVGWGSGAVNASAPIEIADVEHRLTPRFVGPAMHTFFPDAYLVANPKDDNYSRYLKLAPSCSFLAYDESYLESGQKSRFKSELLAERIRSLISSLGMNEIMGHEGRNRFTAALQQVSEPILFPVHIGCATDPYGADEESGLRPGDSHADMSTFRGRFHEHSLKVDATLRTLQLGDGPVISYLGDETDLPVTASDGTSIYVDVTGMKPRFRGSVAVGAMGRIQRVFTGDMIAQ